MEYKQVKRKNGELVVFCNFEDLLKDFYEVGTMEEVETHVNNSTREYIIHCPFCREEGHTKHKLYIKSDLTVGHCFVCGRAFVNVTDEVKVDYKIPNFFPTLNKKPGVNIVTLSDPVWSLDKYYNEFDDFDQKGYDYLVGRNPYLAQLYKILGFKFWDGNIVMPFYYKDKPFYYQIRFTGKSKIRYFFPPIKDKPCWILEHGNLENPAICISEGIFDAIAMLLQAPQYIPVAVLGSSISDYQLDMIREYTPRKIAIFMDETDISIRIANKIKKVIDYCPISIIKSNGEDPEERMMRRLRQGKKLCWLVDDEKDNSINTNLKLKFKF